MLEPIQGEGGIYPAEDAYLRAVLNCANNMIGCLF